MPEELRVSRNPPFQPCLLLLIVALTAQADHVSSLGPSETGSDLSIKASLRQEVDADTASAIEADLTAKAYSRAEERLVSLIQSSEHPRVLLEALGRILFKDSKYLQSAIAFKKAEKYGQLPEAARFTLAMDYVELKRNTWARNELAGLARERTSEPLYAYWLGRLDYDDQRFPSAKEHFQKAIQIGPAFVRAYDGLGLCEEALGNASAAEDNYLQANRLNRQQSRRSAWPPLDYGSMLRKRARYLEAKSLLREAVGIDASSAKGYYELGRLEESMSDPMAAIADLSKAASLDPKDPSPVYALFRLYRKAGKNELAATMMARFSALNVRSENSGAPVESFK